MIAKNCIIVHGSPVNKEKAMSPELRTYDKHWMPWLEKQLIAKGIKTERPLMPEPWEPDYEKYKKAFKKYKVNENTILIGHSTGCTFLVRWLGETKKKVFKLILVAPWKIPQKIRKGADVDFYTYSIDSTIKDRASGIIMFTADDEEENGKKSLKMFHNALGGRVINLPKHGHYCFSNMKTEEFPELLEVVLN